MGTDLYHLSRDLMERSHPRFSALLKKIHDRLREGNVYLDLADEIERELKDARIQ